MLTPRSLGDHIAVCRFVRLFIRALPLCQLHCVYLEPWVTLKTHASVRRTHIAVTFGNQIAGSVTQTSAKTDKTTVCRPLSTAEMLFIQVILTALRCSTAHVC